MADYIRTHLTLGLLLGVTLLIGAAIIYLYYVFFPPHFTGWGEVTQTRTISGWVINRGERHKPVEVQLYIDNGFVAHGVAELPRPDVAKAGWTQDPRCGYSFPLPGLATGDHEAHVYAVHKVGDGSYITLQVTGRPLRFYVDTNGAVRPSD
jgi:hypothetical protein